MFFDHFTASSPLFIAFHFRDAFRTAAGREEPAVRLQRLNCRRKQLPLGLRPLEMTEFVLLV
jgi:hypothetical protein